MTLTLSMPEITELKPRILVIGVGGAGGNAVNNMIRSELNGVDFVVANTDAQSLASSLSDCRIQLGVQITQGLGAGARPDIGAAAAQEALEHIKEQLAGAHMAFITAGMGGGTGTGAAPVIAKLAREQGILTVGVITKPFQFEGSRRMTIANEGVEELQKHVDTLIIIPNQNLFRIANEKTTFADAFSMADNVLNSGVRGITDLMIMPGLINLDFADVRTVMMEMGKAMMGTGEAEGENRAITAAEAAISNPLLDEISMKGAKGVLINITGGNDLTLFEVDEAANRIRGEVDPDANIIVGSTFGADMDCGMRVSVFATGIEAIAGAAQNPSTVASMVESMNTAPALNSPSGLDQAQDLPAFGAGSATLEHKPEPFIATTAQIEESVFESETELSIQTLDDAIEPMVTREEPAFIQERESFMAPEPVEPLRQFEQTVETLPTERPDAFAEAAMANGPSASDEVPAVDPAPVRGPSLLERVTSLAKRGTEHAKIEPVSVVAEEAQLGAADFVELEVIAADESSELEEAPLTLRNVHPADRLEQPPATEDQIDIPAFLRRQAN